MKKEWKTIIAQFLKKKSKLNQIKKPMQKQQSVNCRGESLSLEVYLSLHTTRNCMISSYFLEFSPIF